MSKATRTHIAAAVLGNALEVYDFTTYAYFAVLIGRAFFPQTDDFHRLLASLATFWVGFFARPIGAIIIGAYADRHGRRPALMLTFGLMGAGVLLLALTPPYAAIGAAAPVLVVIARLIQGFALGGEIGPATAFLVEIAPPEQRGFYGGWQSASQGIATLTSGIIGVTVSSLLSANAMQSWGWRVPFLIGAAILPLGLAIRRSLPETHANREAEIPAQEVYGLLRDSRLIIFLNFLIIAGTTIPFYVLAYMTTFAQTTLHMTTTSGLAATAVLGLTNLIFSLIGGLWSDRVGRKLAMILPRLVLVAVVYPTYLALVREPTTAMLLAATAFLAMLHQTSSSVGITVITENLPKPIRGLASSAAYAFAVAIFGGSTQFVVTWLIGTTGDKLAPAWYLALSTLVAVAAMVAMPETSPRFARLREGAVAST
jgi:MFS family permease